MRIVEHQMIFFLRFSFRPSHFNFTSIYWDKITPDFDFIPLLCCAIHSMRHSQEEMKKWKTIEEKKRKRKEKQMPGKGTLHYAASRNSDHFNRAICCVPFEILLFSAQNKNYNNENYDKKTNNVSHRMGCQFGPMLIQDRHTRYLRFFDFSTHALDSSSQRQRWRRRRRRTRQTVFACISLDSSTQA